MLMQALLKWVMGWKKISVKRSSSFCFQDEIINLAGTEWKIRELVDNWDVSSKNVPLIGDAPCYSLLCRELLRGPNYKQLWRGTVAEWSKALLWNDYKWETKRSQIRHPRPRQYIKKPINISTCRAGLKILSASSYQFTPSDRYWFYHGTSQPRDLNACSCCSQTTIELSTSYPKTA